MPGGRPFHSKLVPFEAQVRALRRAGRTYREISAILKAEHGLEVHPDTINSFVIVRARGAKVYTLPEPPPAAPAAPTPEPPSRGAAAGAAGRPGGEDGSSAPEARRGAEANAAPKKYVFRPGPARASDFGPEELEFNDPLQP